MPDCLVNGEAITHVDVSDRGLAYGDGLFETVGVTRQRPWFWQAHIDRLAQGCERLNLRMPPQELLLNELRSVSRGLGHCVVKIVITRGSGTRGYAPGRDENGCRIVSAHPFPEGVDSAIRNGVAARTLELRLAIQPALGGMKHLNRLEQVLAAQELAMHPETEGFLLDQDGFLVSAISSNLFLVSGQQILTPRMDRCGVRGALRGLIVRAFKSRCELRRCTRDMLFDADELFICNAIRGVVPVISVDDREFPIGPVTRELQDWFAARVKSA